MITANWIWKKQFSRVQYNETILAMKSFELGEIRTAILKITADSFYRLMINGVWVNDGPCRSWPEHYQFDEIDVLPYLLAGKNEIRVLARYWGTGTFHTRPQQAGLLAQLDVTLANGVVICIQTDETWQVTELRAMQRNTPKVSIQMEPLEIYDARLEKDLEFEPAHVLWGAEEGPWRDLHARDVPLLTRQPFAFRSFLGASLLQRSQAMNFCVPSALLTHPGMVEANQNVTTVGALSSLMELAQAVEIHFYTQGMKIYIDGHHSDDEKYSLPAGQHLIMVYIDEAIGHNKEKTFRLLNPPQSLHMLNPVDASQANPWVWIPFPEYDYVGDDLHWPWNDLPEDLEAVVNAYLGLIDELGSKIKSLADFRTHLADRAKCLPYHELFMQDTFWQFTERQVIQSADRLVKNPAGLMYDNPEVTTIHPSLEGDIELLYDLGEQNIGYYDFELMADEGVEVDICGVEYITPQGSIQFSDGNRNGMRYIAHAGLNRFTSTKRRSGRFIFITLRNQQTPVQIRKLQLIESTYPVNPVGSFRCSDLRLDRIWEISAHTLKLCMEDTFTDCPLYEQTHWVGDTRNEAAFAYPVFNATDIGRRCITLTGQSLERYPITGCQVPSNWDCLLPAWSFLWGISVWDYYFYSGDKNFLRKVWPWVITNLKGAEKLSDERGLFSGPFWNMFDWSGIDDRHDTVLHNSMLLAGAIQAAQKCADILADTAQAAWLDHFWQELRTSINALWDPSLHAYPDSIHADGQVSSSLSQHTSFLSMLYDVVNEKNAPYVLENTLHPREGMVQVGSPFAIMYYYEALEKAGQSDAILQSIYDAYLPMLADGATTVWETFPSSNVRPGEFPTRSHCHAWSSAPVYFLNRILLGIRPTTPGGTAFEISPRLNGLSWAEGSVATVNGPLHVSWRIQDGVLDVKVRAPQGVNVQFVENFTHTGLKVAIEVL